MGSLVQVSEKAHPVLGIFHLVNASNCPAVDVALALSVLPSAIPQRLGVTLGNLLLGVLVSPW